MPTACSGSRCTCTCAPHAAMLPKPLPATTQQIMAALVLTRHDLHRLSLDHVCNTALGASGLWSSLLMALLVVTSNSLHSTSTSAVMQLKWELLLSSPFFRGSTGRLRSYWSHSAAQCSSRVARWQSRQCSAVLLGAGDRNHMRFQRKQFW
jgi:hypothetical protein